MEPTKQPRRAFLGKSLLFLLGGLSGCSPEIETSNIQGKLEYNIREHSLPKEVPYEEGIDKKDVHRFEVQKGEDFSGYLTIKNPSKDSPSYVYIHEDRGRDLDLFVNPIGFTIPSGQSSEIYLSAKKLTNSGKQKLRMYWRKGNKPIHPDEFNKNYGLNYHDIIVQLNVGKDRLDLEIPYNAPKISLEDFETQLRKKYPSIPDSTPKDFELLYNIYSKPFEFESEQEKQRFNEFRVADLGENTKKRCSKLFPWIDMKNPKPSDKRLIFIIYEIEGIAVMR